MLAMKSCQKFSYISIIVGNPQGILDQAAQASPNPLINYNINTFIIPIDYIIIFAWVNAP
jgi:hypothetical protein